MDQNTYIGDATSVRSKIEDEASEAIRVAAEKLADLEIQMFRWQRDWRGGGFGISASTAMREAEEWTELQVEKLTDEVSRLYQTKLYDQPELKPGGSYWQEPQNR